MVHFKELSKRVQSRFTVVNDDVTYTPSDVLRVCEMLQIPFVYDVHRHRCKPDKMTVRDATKQCVSLAASLNKEPYFHISSPKYGW
jgi:UV DNA damage endonuclease